MGRIASFLMTAELTFGYMLVVFGVGYAVDGKTLNGWAVCIAGALLVVANAIRRAHPSKGI